MARAAVALVSQRGRSEMCTDNNMQISCCTSCMSDSNRLRLQIVCRFLPAWLRQMHASAAYPASAGTRRGEQPPAGRAKIGDIWEPRPLGDAPAPAANALQA